MKYFYDKKFLSQILLNNKDFFTRYILSDKIKKKVFLRTRNSKTG